MALNSVAQISTPPSLGPSLSEAGLEFVENSPEEHGAHIFCNPLDTFCNYRRVRSSEGLGFRASGEEKYGDAVFGRDSLVAARDSLEFDPQAVQEVITFLARHQGTRELPVIEEELRKAVDAAGMIQNSALIENRLEFITQRMTGKPWRTILKAQIEEIKKWNFIPESDKEVLIRERELMDQHVQVLKSEEEKGRILHEYRSTTIHGDQVPLSMSSQALLEELSYKWGGTEDEMTYYGSVDATPLFVQVVADYCHRYGQEILDKDIKRTDGETVKLRDCLADAVSWIEKRIEDSGGLLTYKRANPEGIENQVWMDSRESVIHEDGRPVNHTMPIATIELQGLAYDAYMKAAALMPERSNELREHALRVRQNMLAAFWMGKKEDGGKGYFAMAVGRGQDGKWEQVKTMSSNVATLLNTDIFKELPESEKRMYEEAIVRMIMGPEFLTDVGIRSRAIRHKNLIKEHNEQFHDTMKSPDYHGTWTVWAKETYDVAQGLRRQGFHRFAEQLENRILDSVAKTGAHYEFFYVHPDTGEVYYDAESIKKEIGEDVDIPQNQQTWTITAVRKILEERQKGERAPLNPNAWEYQLEEEILQKMPIIQAPHTLLQNTPVPAVSLDKQVLQQTPQTVVA